MDRAPPHRRSGTPQGAEPHAPAGPNPKRPGPAEPTRQPRVSRSGSPPAYSTTTTGFPSTSIFGVMPSPGAVLADMKPFTRCGAPSAVETVT